MKLLLKLSFCLLLFLGCTSSSNQNSKKPIGTLQASTVDSVELPTDHDFMGEEFARKQLRELLKGRGQPFMWDTLIKSPATAISIAEPLLFDIFGKKQILGERPMKSILLTDIDTSPEQYQKVGKVVDLK